MPAVTKALASQRVAAYFKLATDNEKLWYSVIVFLGALFLIGSAPFYPIYIVPLLAFVCGFVAYRKPQIAVLLGMLLALPAIIYQSPVFGLLFLLIFALAMFEVWQSWMIVAALEVLVLAPFAFPQFPVFGWITILGMAIAALHFGSKKSILISIPSVFFILLLSSIWLTPNSAFMPIRMDIYKPGDSAMLFSKGTVGLLELPAKIATSFSSLFEGAAKLTSLIGLTLSNIIKILFSDSGIIQMVGWAIALYLMAFLSGYIKGGRSQLISSLALLIVIPFNYFISIAFNTPFSMGFVYAVGSSILILALLEQFGVSISREVMVSRKEKLKAYGKFGLQDLALGSQEKSLDAIGGYEDVKAELRDSILMPLEKKEIAYTYGIKPPSGILLFGPPGTGKTMLMRALASELKFGFYYIKSSDILSQWYGESLPYSEKIMVRREGKVELIEIGKVVEEKIEGEVLSFDNSGKCQFADVKKHIKHKCTSPILKVKTRSGRSIKVTDYHSLFTIKGTKIESIPTSELIPKESYIAIPRRIPFTENSISKIDMLYELRKNDYGLYVRASSAIKKAIKKIGEKATLECLKLKSNDLKNRLKNNIGIKANLFYKLMKKADVDYSKEDIVFSGKRKMPVIINIDEHFSTFLGLWVAEGSYNRKDTIRLSTSKDELNIVKSLCESLFGPVTVYAKNGGKGRDIYIGSRPLYVLMNKILGLDHGSKNKRCPNIAFNLNKKNSQALIRGFFSGDGSIYPNQRGVPTIEFATTSHTLADEVMYLLLRFGIVARSYDKKEWSGTQTKRICFTGYQSLNSFIDIGFIYKSKNDRLQKYVQNTKWSRSEQIPIIGGLRNIIKTQLPKWSNSATISRNVLLNTSFEEEVECLEQIENDIYLDRVEKIEKIEDEEYVYDISVNPCQNFVAGYGGIFAHNSEKNLTEIFRLARENAPSILFFDEIDSLGKKRTSYSVDDVGPRILSVMLSEMDGVKTKGKPVLVIGATNVPQQLDPALMRPGRFDKVIYMHLPDREARKAIFQVHVKKIPLEANVDFEKLSKKTNRFSGADIKNVVNEAVKLAAKDASKSGAIVPISMDHFLQVLHYVKPSVSIASLDQYEQFRLDFERRVGIKEEEKPREEITKWEDVVGLDKVKKSLLEAIKLPLLHEDLMKEMKIRPSKGMLLFGPPGTGKTLVVKAATNELKASFQVLSGAEIMKRGYTQAVSVIKETFNRARENTPSIIFVDEIETFAPARGVTSSEIVGQFLTEMDGLKTLKGVVIIAATNKPALLDPALLRPGRFDKIFYISPPNKKGRAEMFKLYLGEFAKDVDLDALASATKGFTGADIALVCQDAKMVVLRARIAGESALISTESVLTILKKRRPSVTREMLKEYEQFLEVYGERGEGEEGEAPPPPPKKKKKEPMYG
jgi:SpoVK/Ycf46/Vps4 family AAA+-type ATPase/intein/homing endonuclease